MKSKKGHKTKGKKTDGMEGGETIERKKSPHTRVKEKGFLPHALTGGTGGLGRSGRGGF